MLISTTACKQYASGIALSIVMDGEELKHATGFTTPAESLRVTVKGMDGGGHKLVFDKQGRRKVSPRHADGGGMRLQMDGALFGIKRIGARAWLEPTWHGQSPMFQIPPEWLEAGAQARALTPPKAPLDAALDDLKTGLEFVNAAAVALQGLGAEVRFTQMGDTDEVGPITAKIKMVKEFEL